MPPPTSARPTKSRHRKAGRKKNHCPVVARDRSSGSTSRTSRSGSTSRTSVLGNSQSSDAEGECSAAETTVKEEPCPKAESDRSGGKTSFSSSVKTYVPGQSRSRATALEDAQPTSSGSAREEPPAQTKFGKLHPETVSELKRNVALLTVDRKKNKQSSVWQNAVAAIGQRKSTCCTTTLHPMRSLNRIWRL